VRRQLESAQRAAAEARGEVARLTGELAARTAEVEQLSSLSLRGDATLADCMAQLKVTPATPCPPPAPGATPSALQRVMVVLLGGGLELLPAVLVSRHQLRAAGGSEGWCVMLLLGHGKEVPAAFAVSESADMLCCCCVPAALWFTR
jgi:hypothetical protein